DVAGDGRIDRPAVALADRRVRHVAGDVVIHVRRAEPEEVLLVVLARVVVVRAAPRPGRQGSAGEHVPALGRRRLVWLLRRADVVLPRSGPRERLRELADLLGGLERREVR